MYLVAYIGKENQSIELQKLALKVKLSHKINEQGVTLALARSPRRVSKVSGERKSTITRPFGEYNFRCQEIIWTLCFTFHFAEKTPKHKLTIISILQSYTFRTDKLALKGNIGLRKKTNMASS